MTFIPMFNARLYVIPSILLFKNVASIESEDMLDILRFNDACIGTSFVVVDFVDHMVRTP